MTHISESYWIIWQYVLLLGQLPFLFDVHANHSFGLLLSQSKLSNKSFCFILCYFTWNFVSIIDWDGKGKIRSKNIYRTKGMLIKCKSLLRVPHVTLSKEKKIKEKLFLNNFLKICHLKNVEGGRVILYNRIDELHDFSIVTVVCASCSFFIRTVCTRSLWNFMWLTKPVKSQLILFTHIRCIIVENGQVKLKQKHIRC